MEQTNSFDVQMTIMEVPDREMSYLEAIKIINDCPTRTVHVIESGKIDEDLTAILKQCPKLSFPVVSVVSFPDQPPALALVYKNGMVEPIGTEHMAEELKYPLLILEGRGVAFNKKFAVPSFEFRKSDTYKSMGEEAGEEHVEAYAQALMHLMNTIDGTDFSMGCDDEGLFISHSPDGIRPVNDVPMPFFNGSLIKSALALDPELRNLRVKATNPAEEKGC